MYLSIPDTLRHTLYRDGYKKPINEKTGLFGEVYLQSLCSYSSGDCQTILLYTSKLLSPIYNGQTKVTIT